MIIIIYLKFWSHELNGNGYDIIYKIISLFFHLDDLKKKIWNWKNARTTLSYKTSQRQK